MQQTSFQRLLRKQAGKRADWEYPFAVAGVNITFMLMQMLDLDAGKANIYFPIHLSNFHILEDVFTVECKAATDLAQLYAVKPRSFIRAVFLQMLSGVAITALIFVKLHLLLITLSTPSQRSSWFPSLHHLVLDSRSTCA